MKPSVDLIIVNYKSTEYLIRCLDSIHLYFDCYFTNITVEDNETGKAIDLAEEKYKDVIFHKNIKNLGFGKAINNALRQGYAPYVVLVNPDSILPDKSLNDAINFLHNSKDVGIVGPKICDQDGSIQGSARRFPNILTSVFGRKSPLTKYFPNNSITKREFVCFDSNETCEMDVDWVSGACMIIRREALEQVGGFDERFFLYWEDTDLCRRIKDAGWRVVYYPKARVTHSVGKSSSTRPIASVLHFHYSCYKLCEKHAKVYFKPLTPFILAGLALRCLFVLSFITLKQKNHAKTKVHGKPHRLCFPEKIKVLRLITRLNIGGPSIHVALLSKELDPKRFESKLAVGSISPYEGDMSHIINDDARVHKIPEMQREIRPFQDIIAFIKILKLIALEKPQIVHTHTAKAGTLGRLAAVCCNRFFNTNCKIVHTFHGNVLEGYFGAFTSACFRIVEKAMAIFSDAVIAISTSQQLELTEKYSIIPYRKSHIIHLGFDLSRFFNSSIHRGTCRKRLGIDSQTLLIGIVGRLVAIKNHHMFLKAAKIFISRNPQIQVRFVVVGDGELRTELQKTALEMGIHEKVSFYGWEREVEKIYADLDILALTSMNEGTPVSIIEAMAASVPVVTTGVGGTQDLLGGFENSGSHGFRICERGILCPNEDPLTFAEAIEFIVRADSKLKSERTHRAREYVLENYSVENLISKIQSLYEHLMMNGGLGNDAEA